jgi:hypothetical protein
MPASREIVPALPGTALAVGLAHPGYAAPAGAALIAASPGGPSPPSRPASA